MSPLLKTILKGWHEQLNRLTGYQMCKSEKIQSDSFNPFERETDLTKRASPWKIACLKNFIFLEMLPLMKQEQRIS